MKARGIACAVFLALLPALAQVAPTRWGSVKAFPHGWVNRFGPGLHLGFPIFSRPGLGGAQLRSSLVYDSGFWQLVNGSWVPSPGGGWQFSGMRSASVTANDSITYCGWLNVKTGFQDDSGTIYSYIFTLVEPDGQTYNVARAKDVDDPGPPPNGFRDTCPSAEPPTPATAVVEAGQDTYTVSIDSGFHA